MQNVTVYSIWEIKSRSATSADPDSLVGLTEGSGLQALDLVPAAGHWGSGGVTRGADGPAGEAGFGREGDLLGHVYHVLKCLPAAGSAASKTTLSGAPV